MSFSLDNGYLPQTIEGMMESIRVNVNAQFGTNYTTENFVGTNFYKYFYALLQRLQENEVKTAEIFLKLQDYFRITNERIARPRVTPNGLVEVFENAGFIASVKPMVDADAGKIHVCVQVDDTDEDYPATRLQLCTILKDSTAIGAVTQGDQVESLTLTNGQSFDYKYNLPNEIPTLLRLTITVSVNNQVAIKGPDDIKQDLLNNIASMYRLGRDFEPQRLYTVQDAPWASEILLEYSFDDGETWLNQVYAADYDDLLIIGLADIELVED